MLLVVCVDEKNGMLFNHRRQSQDREVRKRILEDAAGTALWMNDYSRRQFSEPEAGQIRESEDFLEKAGPGEWCFAENVSAAPWESRIEKIVCYRWDRIYPADFWFDISLAENGWKLAEQKDFKGYSHEKVTKEMYIK